MDIFVNCNIRSIDSIFLEQGVVDKNDKCQEPPKHPRFDNF